MTPPTSWSQIMEQTPGYGMTASSGGLASTSLGGMSRLVPPPPGISIWDPFPWKALAPAPAPALACHDVAAQGMASHHPGLESGAAKSLSTQVLCMISEYHLTCLSQGPSYISPVLPEAAKTLLPGSDFQGTWDLRVLERAKTLRVAVWLHHLDMAATGDGEASYSLEVTWHARGPLVEFLLTPQASSLMFEEVID